MLTIACPHVNSLNSLIRKIRGTIHVVWNLNLLSQKLNRHNAQQRFALRFRIFKDKIQLLQA